MSTPGLVAIVIFVAVVILTSAALNAVSPALSVLVLIALVAMYLKGRAA